MEYLLGNRFFVTITELLFSLLFFPSHMCHAGKKAVVTTSGMY